MKKKLPLTVIFVLAFIALGIAIEQKKNGIREARKAEVVTVLKDLTQNGAPVNVSTVSKQSFSEQFQVSLNPCSHGSCFTTTKEFQKKLHVGMRVFEVGTSNIIGHISHISSTSSITDGLFQVHINHKSRNESQYSAASIEVRKLTNVIVVPLSSIEYRDSKPFVYIVGKDNAYETRSVSIGAQNINQALVTGDLNVGEQIIVQGHSLIKRFGKINILEMRN